MTDILKKKLTDAPAMAAEDITLTTEALVIDTADSSKLKRVAFANKKAWVLDGHTIGTSDADRILTGTDSQEVTNKTLESCVFGDGNAITTTEDAKPEDALGILINNSSGEFSFASMDSAKAAFGMGYHVSTFSKADGSISITSEELLDQHTVSSGATICPYSLDVKVFEIDTEHESGYPATMHSIEFTDLITTNNVTPLTLNSVDLQWTPSEGASYRISVKFRIL